MVHKINPDITVNAAGKALLIIFLNKFPLMRSRFGSNASMNDGMPIVTALIKVICIGIKGYGAVINKNSNESRQE